MAGLIGMTVVGGGVVGCCIAYRLALEGVPVTLIERQHVGAGASGASAGNVQPGEFESALGAEEWHSGRIPILGPIPELAGVYLAVPSSNGFLLSAALAHMLTELLVRGRHHPFSSRIVPERVLQSPTPT
jgi:glycine/D-amino acid oxidase-like deaminating enzyme